MALSGSYKIKISNTSSTPNEWLQLSWTVNSQSVETNKSNITFAIQIYSTYSSAYQPYSIDNSSAKTVSLSVNGTQRYYAHNDQWGPNPVVVDFRGTSASNPATLGSWTGNISHASDGTSNAITLLGELFYGDTETSHTGLTGDHQISYTIPAGAINPIARASAPTCPANSEFGSTIKITTNRASSSFTHKLTFSCNGHSQTVNDVGASYNFTIPASWAPTNSDASKTLTVTCVTYNGSTNLGSNTCSSTVAVPASWIPSVTINYSLSPSGDFLANISTATLTAVGTATYYASIQTYSWSGGAVSGSGATKTHSPTAAGTYTYTVTVTDSRSRTGTATLRLTCTDSSSAITLSASSLYFGHTITATITPKKNTFRHVLSYSIGETTAADDISLPAGTLTAPQTIPAASASAIPTSKSGTLTVTCKTYNGNTLVGSSYATAKIKVPSSWKPTVGTISVHTHQNSSFNGQYLKNHSAIYVKLTDLAASTGSTLQTVRYLGQNLDYVDSATESSPIHNPAAKSSKIFTKAGTFTYEVTVTDVRGLSDTGTSPSVTVIDYSFPTLTLTAHRCTSQGVANDFGEYIQAYFSGTWSSNVNGNNWSAYLYMREHGDTNEPTLVWSATNQTGSLSIDSSVIQAPVDNTYELKAVVTDAVGHSSEEQWMVVSTGNVLVDLYKDKLVTLFKTASAGLMTDLGMTTNDNIAYADGTTFLNGRTYIPANGSDDGFANGWERIGSSGGGGGSSAQSDWNETDANDPAYIKNKPGYAGINTPGLISTSSQWMTGAKGADGVSTTDSFYFYRSNAGGEANRTGRFQIQTQTVNNKSVTKRILLRQYSYDSSTGNENGWSETYRFPIVEADKNSLSQYDILTSKTFTYSGVKVVDRNNPDAMKTKLVALNAKTRTGTSTYGTAPWCILHFSDIHGDGDRLKNVIDFKNYYSDYIADILHTGDTVNYKAADGIDFWASVSGSENILNCVGNHDTLTLDPTDWISLTMAQTYNTYFKNYISNWGVTYTANKTYYYKDYTTNNLRLIVLDIMHQDSAQLTWFTNTLASAKTNGYHVVVAMHGRAHWKYRAQDVPWDDAAMNPGRSENTYTKAGFAVGDTSARNGSQYPSNLTTGYPAAVQAFIDDGGTFVCWLHGHTHFKMFAKLMDYPDQLDVSVGNDGMHASQISGSHQYVGSNSYAKEEGTKSEDDFNIVAVDTYAKILRIAKVGVDYDRYMRHCDTISYNYGTGEILYSSDNDGSEKANSSPLASMSMFGSFGICGASWDSGYVYYDGSNVTEDDYLSWGANVARNHGNVCKNFARHSMNTRTYLTNSYCLPALLKDTACGLYYIGLGGNDSSSLGLSYLGTIADITNDYTQNPDTFYGNYARIIEQIQNKAPNAKIICAMWYSPDIHDSTREAFYNAVVEIAEHYSLPHFNWDDDPWYTPNVNSGLVQNHPTEALLSGVAMCFDRLFNKCVVENYSYFKYYQGSDFTDRTLFSGTFKNTSSTLTLAGATRYKNITFMGRTGSSIDINCSVTIPVSNISTSAINHLISDPLSYFAFSLTKSGKDVLVNYVSETSTGSGRIVRIYWS